MFIKFSICFGYIGVPLTALVFYWTGDRSAYHLFFTIFILFHSFERVWETFFTTKERKSDRLQGDWTLVWVTIAYIALCLMAIIETNLIVNESIPAITMMGLVIYVLAFLIRWWGMKSLGKQWAIHAVGARKIRRIRLIKVGAFKYVRHPIYGAIILEVMSIPLVGNAFFSLLFAIFCNIPLQLLRLIEEEKTSVRRFGDRYIEYKKEVSALIPIKFIKKKLFISHVAG